MSLIPWLDETFEFPDIKGALDDPNGLLAAGGDLNPLRLLNAYRNGIFPWFDDHQPILWWSPDPRAVILPEHIHISRSLAKHIRRDDFRISFDEAFSDVVQACAAPRSYSDGTWITDEMHAAYCEIHRMGYAHSLEVWQQDSLIGGLYGISLGKLFFGESMFSNTTNGSKIALVALAKQLQSWQFPLIDCQIPNPHLSSMGAIEISRADFSKYLNNYAGLAHPTGRWHYQLALEAIV
jgi:leucyl/phenylalanyl-tRNA--protein transferase